MGSHSGWMRTDLLHVRRVALSRLPLWNGLSFC